MNKILMVSLFLLIACGQQPSNSEKHPETNPEAVPVNTDVIYGADNRVDLYNVTDPALLAVSDSTVALVKSDNLDISVPGTSTITGNIFGQAYNLCSSEPFGDQLSGAFCSGFLINEDTVVTAGHCVATDLDCSTTKFAFGFSIKQKGVMNNSLPSSEVYSCKRIVHSQHPGAGADFAIVQLDRKVTNHIPLSLRSTGIIPIADPVFVIGHPVGLPTKIAGGANVRQNSDPGFFTANIDSYGGNSGSAVFNAKSFEVEGVLVRGEQDFENFNGCTISKKCADAQCRGEDVTKITEILPFLESAPPVILGEEAITAAPLKAIPDNSSKGITSVIDVTSQPQGRRVLVKINVLHPKVGDLVIKLIAPDGTSTLLQNRKSTLKQNITGIYGLDLPAPASLTNLSKIVATGSWTLQIQDRAARNVGKLVEWGILFMP